MGLDMYLTAKKWFSKYDEEKKVSEEISNLFPDLKGFKLDEVSFEVGYWRKANHIHDWFVKNIQDNNDDCGYYDVSVEQLKELLGLVEAVLDKPNKAKELLPTSEGFFFGGTNYDESYFEQLENTKEIINKIFGIVNLKEFSLTYHSSW